MIQIKNLRYEKPKHEWDVKVDRTSILGNPFYMQNESQRDEVCDKYEEYFQEKMKNDEEFRREVERLCNLHIKHSKLNIFCWCTPKRCHAETILRGIIKYCSNLRIK